MKKLTVIICFLFGAFSCFAHKLVKIDTTSESSIHIVDDNFEGVIFSDGYFMVDSITRFTPGINEILLAERLIKTDKIKVGDYVSHIGFGARYPMKKYLRQYFGYINRQGQKIIFVNCLPEDYRNAVYFGGSRKKLPPSWFRQYMWVLNNFSNTKYWYITVNLNTKKALSFQTDDIRLYLKHDSH